MVTPSIYTILLQIMRVHTIAIFSPAFLGRKLSVVEPRSADK